MSTVLRIYESGTFAGAMCNIRVDMSMNHGDTSLLGLDGDWDSKVGSQAGRLQDSWSDHMTTV